MDILVIDQKLKVLVKTERKMTHEILLLVQTLDLTEGYRKLKYNSLYAYLTKEIGYSEGAANRRIAGARLMKGSAEINDAIKNGELNLTQASLVQSAIRQEEKKTKKKVSQDRKVKTVQSLQKKTTFETQKALLEEYPAFEIPKPKAQPARGGKVQVTMEFTEEEWQEVQDLMAKMSHKVPDQKMESLLLYWARQLKAKQEAQAAKKSPPLRRQTGERVKQPVQVRAQLFQSADDRCEYQSPVTGERCSSKHFLEIDHVQALALGGDNHPRNLRILCRAHNRLAATESGLMSPATACMN